MQTFLPYPNFCQSAKVLDFRRLGKQRVEAMQIHNTLVRGSGWSHHPAVKMWKGFELALLVYQDTMIQEWIARGYKNTMPLMADTIPKERIVYPWWLGMDRFHASHRSNLLRKDKEYYQQFGWTEPDNLDYFWPV